MNTKIKWMIGSLYQIIENCICVVGHLMAVALVIALVASITTILYHTGHRIFWANYISFVSAICIICAASSVINFVLAEFAVFPEQLSQKLQKRAKSYKVEITIVFVLCFISIVRWMFLMGGTGQTFTGDPWWYPVGRTVHFIAWCILFTRILQQITYDSIKKRFDEDTFHG